MNDYIILVDENGQAYISHGERAVHKYLKKIIENGKAIYFYTQKEIDAYNKKREKKAYDRYTNNYAEKVLKEREKQGKKSVKEQQKVEKQQAKEQKKAEKQSNYRETDLKTYLTGGSEQDEYKRAKKRLESAKENLSKKEDAYNRAQQTNSKFKRITAKTGVDVIGSESREQKAREEYLKAKAELEKEKKRYAEAEKDYEETSLAGQVHRTGRKTAEATSNFLRKMGGSKVKTKKSESKPKTSGQSR